MRFDGPVERDTILAYLDKYCRDNLLNLIGQCVEQMTIDIAYQG
jgi:hypothetical protein